MVSVLKEESGLLRPSEESWLLRPSNERSRKFCSGSSFTPTCRMQLLHAGSAPPALLVSAGAYRSPRWDPVASSSSLLFFITLGLELSETKVYET